MRALSLFFVLLILPTLSTAKTPKAIPIEANTKPSTPTELARSALELLKNNDSEKAAEILKVLIPLLPEIQNELSLSLAQSLHAHHDNQKALEALPDTPLLPSLYARDYFWTKADILLSLEKTSELWNTLNDFQKKYPRLESDHVLYYRYLAAKKDNNIPKMTDVLHDLFVNHAGSRYENGLTVNLTISEQLRRAQNLVESGYPKKALEVYEQLKLQHVDVEDEIAYATFKDRDYVKAAELYRQLYKRTGSESYLKQLAISYGRSDQFEKALEHYRLLEKKTTSIRQKEFARYKIAFTLFDSGRYNEAYNAFDQLIKARQHFGNDDSKTYRLWAGFILKKYDWFRDEIVRLNPSKRGAPLDDSINYWIARSFEMEGKKDQARRLFLEIKKNNPTTYYGFISSLHLENNQNEINIGAFTHLTASLPANPSPFLLSKKIDEKTILASPLKRALLLTQAGYELYVPDELARLSDFNNIFDFESYAGALAQINYFSKLMGLGLTALKTSPPTSDQTIYWQMAYPKAYENWVNDFANSVGLDPAIALAIMREESAFKPGAESNALALGLMQIIPQTGYEIAGYLNDSTFHPEDLLQAPVAIKYGTFYLKKIMNQVGGSLVETIASYNAGPEAVLRWKHWGDQLPLDLFIELIPYDETRAYVKKVLKSYWIYKNLYQ